MSPAKPGRASAPLRIQRAWGGTVQVCWGLPECAWSRRACPSTSPCICTQSCVHPPGPAAGAGRGPRASRAWTRQACAVAGERRCPVSATRNLPLDPSGPRSQNKWELAEVSLGLSESRSAVPPKVRGDIVSCFSCSPGLGHPEGQWLHQGPPPGAPQSEGPHAELGCVRGPFP